jgi:hypothetical protein
MTTRTERLAEILDDMDIPQMRKDIAFTPNLYWLQRNLLIRNGAHAHAREALTIIRALIAEG